MKKWIYFRNPSKSGQASERFEQLDTLCVWWNFEEALSFELVPDGHVVKAQQMHRVYNDLKARNPPLVNRRRALL